MLRRAIRKLRTWKKEKKEARAIAMYLKNGRVAWSEGYHFYKAQEIIKVIQSNDELNNFREQILPPKYGIGMDERIVEIPYVLSQLSSDDFLILDAGSSLNYESVLLCDVLKEKEVTICTFHPENSFTHHRISYVYSDLRDIYFKNQAFDAVISISTLEHVDMDNSIYGYDVANTSMIKEKSYEYMRVIIELVRVIKSGGKILITVPFGIYENHGYFQQFDEEMIGRITEYLKEYGDPSLVFFKYKKDGWQFSDVDHVKGCKAYNPHTGQGYSNDGAAHSRAICCIRFLKS